MIIYGAGLAGLLAGNMLRSFSPIIYEAQSELPNNQGALLRFRTDKVGTACAIPFKKVKVHKAIKYSGELHNETSLFLSNLYSQKVTGSILNRSINSLDSVDRYIAPWELINTMSRNCKIEYDMKLTKAAVNDMGAAPTISTIPMPTLMDIMGWPDKPEFPTQKIWTQKARIESPDCKVHQTIYYPDPTVPYYRISLVGDVVISEFIRKPEANIGPHIMDVLLEDFGIKPNKLVDMKSSEQYLGKIKPINEEIRKQFIFEMTTKYGIYSLGRFATWRQILLDDVAEDVQHIENFIRSSSSYSRLIHSQKGETQ
jgi:hypothetical protein|tara:strand:- start:89 stop:1027 length:939 start_codon:yes stop_codon:yes gene_type:complete